MMHIAKRAAAHSIYPYRLGAVITKGSRVLATGHNSISYCSVNNFQNSRHAEMDAILHLLHKHNGLSSLAGSTLYVTRITKTGRTAMAKPCKKCMALILSVGIRDIFYTTDNGSIERIKL
jgi:deoxycytidylate deaminase